MNHACDSAASYVYKLTMGLKNKTEF
jgi:hypothetical protein